MAARGGGAGGAPGGTRASWYTLAGLGLLATIAVTVYVTRLARQALREAHLDAEAEGPVSG